jgi:hypothetical protein
MGRRCESYAVRMKRYRDSLLIDLSIPGARIYSPTDSPLKLVRVMLDQELIEACGTGYTPVGPKQLPITYYRISPKGRSMVGAI